MFWNINFYIFFTIILLDSERGLSDVGTCLVNVVTIEAKYGNYMESFGYTQAIRYFSDNELGHAFG